MRTNRPRVGDPEVSVVVPVVERIGDLAQIYREFSAELSRLGRSAEFIFVVEERLRGEVLPVLRQLQEGEEREILIVLLGGRFGESAALTLGLDRARGEIIVTLASYFQVEPNGLGAAFAELEKGVDLVGGRRFPRIDSAFNRAQSRLFHWFVSRLTSTDFHDVSCGFKVMRRRVARELNLYGGLHRFIPVLALSHGFTVREIPVAQRVEDRGTRYYGTGVYLGRLLDILTIFFLMKFTRMPLRFFGLLGSFLFAGGFPTAATAAVEKVFFQTGISDRAALLLGVLLMVLGVQTLSLGLIGEIIIFTHARNVREYKVAEVIRKPSRPELVLPPGTGDEPAIDGARQAS